MPILSNCIKRPAMPVARDYRPASGQKYRVRDGDSWESLARTKGMGAWELIRYRVSF